MRSAANESGSPNRSERHQKSAVSLCTRATCPPTPTDRGSMRAKSTLAKLEATPKPSICVRNRRLVRSL